jgi:RES domain-containing protein
VFIHEPPSGVPGIIKAYRIVKRKFVRIAFSGEGARLYGGRWNSPGVRVVYTSGSISLALHEWRVHLTQWPTPPVSIIEIEFSASLIRAPARLPVNWSRTPCPKSTSVFGDNWVRSARSAVMKLPSVIVPEEFNYLLNPAHPDFHKIRIGKARLLQVDDRLGPLRMH